VAPHAIRLRAAFAAAEGRVEDADTDFGLVGAEFAALGDPWNVALTDLAQAYALVDRGDLDAARKPARRAQTTFARLRADARAMEAGRLV
jgi:hypothetical protein